ncbi:MAG TPA: glutamate 5-kinase, partial [Candidatus Hydrogenedentes bacterium]|nr:glutamate 5-kinase [Candidatus Hydrogenedentota bacterium]
IDGLYDRNPSKHPDATLVENVAQVDESIAALAEDTSVETSVGGMKTKLNAARIACASGLETVIANGRTPGIVRGVLDGTARCTRFSASAEALSHRKRWIAFGRATRGTIEIDEGACKALVDQGRSLLAAGIKNISGSFDVGAAVRIRDAEGRDIACGLVNYASSDLDRIKGCKSSDIQSILGRKDFDEVIHRDNLVLL